MTVLNLYHQVIENVIEKMQAEFINNGIDEAVLADLRQLWFNKLHQSQQFTGANGTEGGDFHAADPSELEDDDVLYASTSFPFHNYQVGRPGAASGDSAGSKKEGFTGVRNGKGTPGQFDGEDVNGGEDQQPPSRKQSLNADDEDEDDLLNSDLDDDDQNDDSVEVANRLLCQYDKVSRHRSRWKCVLKDGVATIDEKTMHSIGHNVTLTFEEMEI